MYTTAGIWTVKYNTQNAPENGAISWCKIKKNSGGYAPSPNPSPGGKGDTLSALAVFSRNALYKSTFYLLTYLLTPPHTPSLGAYGASIVAPSARQTSLTQLKNTSRASVDRWLGGSIWSHYFWMTRLKSLLFRTTEMWNWEYQPNIPLPKWS